MNVQMKNIEAIDTDIATNLDVAAQILPATEYLAVVAIGDSIGVVVDTPNTQAIQLVFVDEVATSNPCENPEYTVEVDNSSVGANFTYTGNFSFDVMNYNMTLENSDFYKAHPEQLRDVQITYYEMVETTTYAQAFDMVDELFVTNHKEVTAIDDGVTIVTEFFINKNNEKVISFEVEDEWFLTVARRKDTVMYLFVENGGKGITGKVSADYSVLDGICWNDHKSTNHMDVFWHDFIVGARDAMIKSHNG